MTQSETVCSQKKYFHFLIATKPTKPNYPCQAILNLKIVFFFNPINVFRLERKKAFAETSRAHRPNV